MTLFLQNLPQDFWPVIESFSPTAFLWTGDAIYARDNSLLAQQGALETLKGDSTYSNFSSRTQILGVWDDHGKYALFLSMTT